MPIHKLAEGPVVLTVAQVETGLPSKFNAEQTQVKLTGEDAMDVYLNENTAKRQLQRIKLDFETVVGETIHIEQVKKDGTTYTNISKVNTGAAAPRPTTPAAAASPKLSVGELGALYGLCLDQAIGTLAVKCEEAGIPIDASAIQAAAATLFIKATR